MNSLWRWVARQVSPHLDSTRLTSLETQMAKSDEALAQLDAATDEVADILAEVREQLSGQDDALANRVNAAVSRLRAMAKSPSDPDPEAQAWDPATGAVAGTEVTQGRVIGSDEQAAPQAPSGPNVVAPEAGSGGSPNDEQRPAGTN